MIGQDGCVLEGILPLWRHICQSMIHDLGRRQGGVKILEATYTHPVHPLQVQLDAFLGDIAVHPMPPHPRTRSGRGILKSALKRIGFVLSLDGADAE